MGACLVAPIRSQLLSYAGDARFRVGAAAMQGFRRDMEDSECICLGLEGHPDTCFFGVYDGHSGPKVSKHLSEELHHIIAKLGPDFDDEEIKKAVVDFDLNVGKQEFANQGSTCVFVLVRPLDGKTGTDATAESSKGTAPQDRSYKVTAVNVGDSRAMIVRADGSLVSMTEDHKPSNRAEAKRIQDAGGFVKDDRTDGELAMSRAIGDYRYKVSARLGPLEQKVIALPDITHNVAHPGDRILVVCDGVVETLTNKQVARFVHTKQKTYKDDPAMLVRELLLYSLASGSTDNHSGILICLEDGKGYGATDCFIAGPFTAWKNDRNFVNAYVKNAKSWGQTDSNLPALIAEADENMPQDWKKINKDDNSDPLSSVRVLLSVLFFVVIYFLWDFASRTDGVVGKGRTEF